MSASEQESNFKFDEDQVSWATVDFLKVPAKSLSFIFIIFVFISFIAAFVYMAFSTVAITIKAPSIVSSKTPLIKMTAEFDIKVEEITMRNGQKVQKGEAIILGEDRVNTNDFLKYNQEKKEIELFLNKISKNECSQQCILDFRGQVIKYFRYFTNQRLSLSAQKLREFLFKITAKSSFELNQGLNTTKLLLIDLSEMVDLTQKEQVIHAATSGVIIFPRDLTIGSYIKRGSTLFEIIPDDHSVLIKSYIKDKDITKIKKDMEAKVSITAFPPRKYGLLQGTISHIGVTKVEFENNSDYYEIEVSLKQDYFEHNDKKHKLLLGMKGETIFITQYTSILKKYFGKIAGLN